MLNTGNQAQEERGLGSIRWEKKENRKKIWVFICLQNEGCGFKLGRCLFA